MAEHPILFSGEMVRAILEGRKTQTRRVITTPGHSMHYGRMLCDWALSSGPYQWDGEGRLWQWRGARPAKPGDWVQNIQVEVDDYVTIPLRSYGVPGDRLWVRETWAVWDRHMTRAEAQDAGIPNGPDGLLEGSEGYWRRRIIYRADGEPDPVNPWAWKPSIHMPRWASRLTLEITDVRVQRVQGISEEDAIAEGAPLCDEVSGRVSLDDRRGSYRPGFRALWDSINAKRGFGWAVNPWVWAISFRRLA